MPKRKGVTFLFSLKIEEVNRKVDKGKTIHWQPAICPATVSWQQSPQQGDWQQLAQPPITSDAAKAKGKIAAHRIRPQTAMR